MFPSLYQTANIFAHNFKSLSWTRPSLLLQGGNPVSLPSWHPDSPPHPEAWSLASGRSVNMNWQRCSGQLLALVTNYLNSRHFLLHRHRRTTDHAPRFRTRDPITPAFLQKMLSIASPQPPRQAPKAPSCSRARGSRPRESDPPLGSRRARWQQAGRAARAPGSRGCLRSGAVLPPLPLRARPVPKEDTPPPAGRLPTLRGAASRARPPARAGPEPPRQPASEGSALGWDLEEAAKEETAAAPRASSPAPTSGLPEESRGSRSGDEAREEDPGGCAPVSLPRRRRRRQRRLQVSRARSPRGPCLAPRPRGADDRPTPTDRQTNR